jgi:hypothetical protein
LKKENNKKIVLVIVGIAVLVGVFYGGMIYSKSQIPTRGAQAFGAGNFSGGAVGARGTKNGGGFTTGEIISKDTQSITVNLVSGGSKIVFYTDKTSITKTVNGTLPDLIIGKQVSVSGAANADGSFNAQSVQIKSNIVPPVVK